MLGYEPAVLAVGDTFEFETHGGRKGVGVVMEPDKHDVSDKPYAVRWWDGNGKHYERFKLEDFKSLKVGKG